MKVMKPIREFKARDKDSGERLFYYHTAIGTFEAQGKSGSWIVRRGGQLLGDVELLDDVERIINAVVAGAV
jgi:hypothetical protein